MELEAHLKGVAGLEAVDADDRVQVDPRGQGREVAEIVPVRMRVLGVGVLDVPENQMNVAHGRFCALLLPRDVRIGMSSSSYCTGAAPTRHCP